MKRKPNPVSTALVQYLQPGKGVSRINWLAENMKVSSKAVLKWRDRGLPAERVLDVWAFTGLSPYQLRPDLYPDPEWTPPNSAAMYRLQVAA